MFRQSYAGLLIVLLGLPTVQSLGSARADEKPEKQLPALEKLKQLGEAYEKARAEALQEVEAEAQKTQAAHTAAVEAFSKAVRSQDKDAIEKARKEMDQAREAMHKTTLLRASIQAQTFPGGRNAYHPKEEEKLGLQLNKPSDDLISQLGLEKDRGLIVLSVKEKSTAAQAGLQKHDVILKVTGKDVSTDINALRKSLAELDEKKTNEIVVLRKGKEQTIKLEGVK